MNEFYQSKDLITLHKDIQESLGRCVGPETDSSGDKSETGGPTISSTVKSGVAPRY